MPSGRSILRWWKSAVNLSFLPLPCDLSYAFQRLGHAFPVLRPARALLARVPLGPGPSLHRLRRRSPGFFHPVRERRCSPVAARARCSPVGRTQRRAVLDRRQRFERRSALPLRLESKPHAAVGHVEAVPHIQPGTNCHLREDRVQRQRLRGQDRFGFAQVTTCTAAALAFSTETLSVRFSSPTVRFENSTATAAGIGADIASSASNASRSGGAPVSSGSREKAGGSFRLRLELEIELSQCPECTSGS